MSKTGNKTQKEKYFLLKEASPDDPIYKAGFIVGHKNASHFSINTPEKTVGSEQKNEDTVDSDLDNDK